LEGVLYFGKLRFSLGFCCRGALIGAGFGYARQSG
jgi:hypothetical protein